MSGGAVAVRLLLVQAGGAVGGAERAIWELATRLRGSRFAVGVWLSADPALDELADCLLARGVATERRPELRPFRDPWGVMAAWAALRRSRPAILHVHRAAPGLRRGLLRLARLAGVPHLVVSEHGRDAGASPGSGPDRELALADVVTVPSRATAAQTSWPLPRDRVRIVPHGASPPDEAAERPLARRLRERHGAGPFRPLWVCVGRPEPGNGRDVLLEALGRLREEGLDFVVVLAGEGSRGSLPERRVADLGLGPRIRFASREEPIGPLLMAADALVVPSLEEPAPRSILEALARGRPVVATEMGMEPHPIEDGIHGRVVPPGDAGALAEALRSLHRKPEEARRMGLDGTERFRARFAWSRVVDGYEAVYDEVLGLASFSREPPARSARGRAVQGSARR